MTKAPAAAGALLALSLWTLPLADWLGAFPAHMLRHAALVAVVPALMAPALPPLRLPLLPVAMLEALAAWGWHLPAAHTAALLPPALRVAEQGSFLLAGILVWWGALSSPLAGAGALLLTSFHMTMLGALITLAPRPLYPYCDLAAQQAGGVLMLAVATPTYLIGGLILVRRGLVSG